MSYTNFVHELGVANGIVSSFTGIHPKILSCRRSAVERSYDLAAGVVTRLTPLHVDVAFEEALEEEAVSNLMLARVANDVTYRRTTQCVPCP